MNNQELFEASESIARGDDCPTCGASWENHELIHREGCPYWEQTENPPLWDPADPYDRYLFDQMMDVELETGHPVVLPLSLPRELADNECVGCGNLPTPDNPAWHFNGQPADLENGPSERDIPHVVCEKCIMRSEHEPLNEPGQFA